MLPAYLADAKFWHVLYRIDEDLAAEVQAVGCVHCDAALHSARYPRKPRGVARALLGEDYEYRLSFCCAREGCRRRATPGSVRFHGRRVYLGALVVLVGVLSQGLTVKRRSQLCQQLRLSERSVGRWRRWWREVFPATPWWRGARGQFVPALEVAQLPASLLERFVAPEPAQQLRDALLFLAPLSRGAEHVD
jgi:hypothetical protein